MIKKAFGTTKKNIKESLIYTKHKPLWLIKINKSSLDIAKFPNLKPKQKLSQNPENQSITISFLNYNNKECSSFNTFLYKYGHKELAA